MSTRIVTVTPNPSVDRTLEVDRLRRGRVLRATAARTDAGGKGVNVARALVANGVPACAVVPLGGPDGRLLAALLNEAAISYRAVPVPTATRSNVTISEAGGRVTKVNAPGEPLPPEAIDRLVATATAELGEAAWLVGCGSLPAGAPDDLFAVLAARARDAGVRMAVDTSGAPLAAAVDAGVDLLKPNLAELVELVGSPLHTLDDVVSAAAELRTRGVAAVVVSLGSSGAVLVDGAEPVLAAPPPVAARSDVGAGDTLLAGFLAAGARGPDALRTGVAWAAAAVALPGTSMPRPDQIDPSGVVLRPAQGTEPLARSSAA